MTHWCSKKDSNLSNLLQNCQERAESRAEEEHRQAQLKTELHIEREHLQNEEDTLHAHRLANFQQLLVSFRYFFK